MCLIGVVVFAPLLEPAFSGIDERVQQSARVRVCFAKPAGGCRLRIEVSNLITELIAARKGGFAAPAHNYASRFRREMNCRSMCCKYRCRSFAIQKHPPYHSAFSALA